MFQIAISLYKQNKESSEYETVFELPEIDTCTFMKTIYKKYFYETVSKYSNLPHFNECPVPHGSFTMKSYPFDLNVFRTQLHPGNYRLNLFLVHHKVAVSGVLAYGSITEKS